MKIEYADEARSLGTGENDYAAQLDAARDAGAASVFGTLGYRVTGDPSGVNYRDVLYGTLGVERALERNTVGAALDAQQSYLSSADTFASVTGYLTAQPDKSAKITAYLLLGLSDTAPDCGAGMTYGWYY